MNGDRHLHHIVLINSTHTLPSLAASLNGRQQCSELGRTVLMSCDFSEEIKLEIRHDVFC